jgi:hypothetical protein
VNEPVPTFTTEYGPKPTTSVVGQTVETPPRGHPFRRLALYIGLGTLLVIVLIIVLVKIL